MNLEDVELQCFNYLSQSQNPIVPVDSLLRFLQRNEEHEALTERELLHFLNHHTLFHVIEPIPMGEAAEARELADAGLAMRPSVMLVSRVPTALEVKESMLASIDRMASALEAALEEAGAAHDRAKARQVRQILRRAAVLRQHVEQTM